MLQSLNNLGNVLRAQGRLREAEPLLREALEKRRRVLGEEHPSTLRSINSLGVLLQAQGRLREAEPYFREALEQQQRILRFSAPPIADEQARRPWILTCGRHVVCVPCFPHGTPATEAPAPLVRILSRSAIGPLTPPPQGRSMPCQTPHHQGIDMEPIFQIYFLKHRIFRRPVPPHPGPRTPLGFVAPTSRRSA